MPVYGHGNERGSSLSSGEWTVNPTIERNKQDQKIHRQLRHSDQSEMAQMCHTYALDLAEPTPGSDVYTWAERVSHAIVEPRTEMKDGEKHTVIRAR